MGVEKVQKMSGFIRRCGRPFTRDLVGLRVSPGWENRESQ